MTSLSMNVIWMSNSLVMSYYCTKFHHNMIVKPKQSWLSRIWHDRGGIPLTSCNSPFWMAIPISLKTVKASLSVFGVMIYGIWNVRWKIACAWIRTRNSIMNRANVNHYATTTCLRQKSNLSWWSITTILRHLGQ